MTRWLDINGWQSQNLRVVASARESESLAHAASTIPRKGIPCVPAWMHYGVYS